MASNVLRNVQKKIADSSLITNKNWESITKTRYVHFDSNHTFLRVDEPMKINPLTFDKIDFDSEIMVISDYNKGYLPHDLIFQICSNHPLVFLDTKKILGKWAEKATFIKVNNYEYINSEKNITDLLKNKIIRTLGNKGCEFKGENFPVESHEIKDTSGAGDTFLAALVCEFLKTKSIESSIRVANSAASQVVRHRGVGTLE
jgi:bifunctional ADP-heptose synthase (sugar kinase/adenylyltransferase)